MIRKAFDTDIPFIADMILTAMHIPFSGNEPLRLHMVTLVSDPHSLYYWRRCHVFCDVMSNEPLGLLLAYDAADYHERRVYSFSLPLKDGTPVESEIKGLLEQEDESGPGEYYIDSLAVVPMMRKHGIGRHLLDFAVAQAAALSLRPTLLVDPENPSALKLYQEVGFVFEREMFAFGTLYHKYVMG